MVRPHWTHSIGLEGRRAQVQWAAGWLISLGRASHLPTVPTLAILASPVYPVVPHERWLVEEERSIIGVSERWREQNPRARPAPLDTSVMKVGNAGRSLRSCVRGEGTEDFFLWPGAQLRLQEGQC